jgi:hypothetical protein
MAPTLVLALTACAGTDASRDFPGAPPLERVTELMRRAGGDTVEVTVADWIGRRLRAAAAQRVRPDDSSGWTAYLPLFGVERVPPDACTPPNRGTTQTRTELWIDRPRRRLLAETRSRDGRRVALLRDGALQRSLSGGDLVTIRLPAGVELSSQAGSAEPLLRPRWILPTLRLRSLGVQQMSSGTAAVLRGTARGGPDAGLVPMGGIGEDELRLWVDLRTGIVVQVEALLDGRPFVRTTIERLALDRPIPSRRFRIDAPAGVRRLTLADLTARPTTAARAAAAVPFTVFAPPGGGAAQLQRSRPGLAGPVVSMPLSGGGSAEQHRAGRADACLLARGRRLTRGGVTVTVQAESADWYRSARGTARRLDRDPGNAG